MIKRVDSKKREQLIKQKKDKGKLDKLIKLLINKKIISKDELE
jgi:hypothetical protein